jgi:hypothetical protein
MGHFTIFHSARGKWLGGDLADVSGLLPLAQALSSAGIETTALDGQSVLAYIKRTPTPLKSKARHAGV